MTHSLAPADPGLRRAPTVSVLLPVRNGERWIRECLEGLQGQTFQDFEVIVVDDGSSDASVDLVRSLELPALRIVKGDGQGLAAALNTGLAACRADLVARQDQDDVSLPMRLELQVRFLLANREYVAVGSSAIEVNEQGLALRSIKVPESDAAIRLQLCLVNPMIHSSVMFRKDAAIAAGGYRSPNREPYPEDFDLWSRLIHCGKFANLPRPLLTYRHHEASVSRSHRTVLARGARSVALSNVLAVLGSGEVKDSDRRLIGYFHGRDRRISPREALRLMMLMSALARELKTTKPLRSWGAGLLSRPIRWVIWPPPRST